MKLKIERLPTVLARVPFSRATIYRSINEGLFVPPVNIGARSVGFLSHEVDALICGMATGSDLKVLVTELVQQRASLSLMEVS